MRIGLLASALLPAFFLLWFFYKRDVNPEPRDVLFKTFLRGVLAVFASVLAAMGPALLIRYTVPNPVIAGAFTAILCAALPEEYFKYRVLTRYSAQQPAFDEPMDGVVYGAAASLGFAALENVAYVEFGGWFSAIARAVTAVPGHACYGAIMGYYVGQAQFTPGWPYRASRGFWMAALLHGLYDFPLLAVKIGQELAGTRSPITGSVRAAAGVSDTWAMVAAGASMLVDLFALVWTIRIVQRLRREQFAAAVIPSSDPPTPAGADFSL